MSDLRTQLQSTLGDDYSLERELGGGGMSRVFVARELLRRNLAQLPVDRPNQTEGILAYVLARAGKPVESRSAMDHLRRVSGGELPPMAVLAATLEVLGDHAGAVDMIARAVKQPDNWLQMYNRAERYDALRKDPRADAIMKSIEQ